MSKTLDYRLRMASMSSPKNSLDRSRKLKSLLVTRNKLECRGRELETTKKLLDTDIKSNRDQLTYIKAQIDELSPDDSVIVTEHALLRYIERYMGIDIQKVHDDILDLPNNDLVVAGNTIVTVYPDENDNFNLAENERQ